MKTVISNTDNADGRVCGGGSYVSMGGLVIRKCAHGDCEDGGDYRTVDIDVAVAYSRAVSGQDLM